MERSSSSGFLDRFSSSSEKEKLSSGDEESGLPRRKASSLGRASGRRARALYDESVVHEDEPTIGRRRGGSSSASAPPSSSRTKSYDKSSSSKDRREQSTRRLRLLTGLAACTILFGPVGTMLSFWLMPDDGAGSFRFPWSGRPAAAPPGAIGRGGGVATTAGAAHGHTRVLHLALAGSDARARFVIDEQSSWESFEAGCRERLKISGVARVTDEGGEGIHTIRDLIHGDNIIVHAIGGAPAASNGTATPPAAPAAATTAATTAAPTTAAPTTTEAPACPPKHPDFRVAMLVPLIGQPPPYLPYFIASAGRSAQLVDWLVFHEQQHIMWERPPNIKFVDLGGGGLAELIGLKLGEHLSLPLRNATVLLRSLKILFERWPRLVAEYKPAFGSVFGDFIAGYTHWGYCDVDVVFGNVPHFFEYSELAAHDIFSWGYGDQEALYLRGQWTVHRNADEVNQVWQRCAHLAADLQRELALKVSWLKSTEGAAKKKGDKTGPTRFLSAEGCYSWHAARAQLRMRISSKQAVGLDTSPSGEQVLSVGGAVWRCPADVAPTAELRSELAVRTAGEPCRLALPAVHPKSGAEAAVAVAADGCGKWIPAEFRMCATNLPADKQRRAAVALGTRDGGFYSQAVDDAATLLPNGCRQVAFFHFQEWKKLWEASGELVGGGRAAIAPLKQKETLSAPAYRITADGITHWN